VPVFQRIEELGSDRLPTSPSDSTELAEVLRRGSPLTLPGPRSMARGSSGAKRERNKGGPPVPLGYTDARTRDVLWASTKCRLPNSPNFGKFLAR
jgi:hypothetical protein